MEVVRVAQGALGMVGKGKWEKEGRNTPGRDLRSSSEQKYFPNLAQCTKYGGGVKRKATEGNASLHIPDTAALHIQRPVARVCKHECGYCIFSMLLSFFFSFFFTASTRAHRYHPPHGQASGDSQDAQSCHHDVRAGDVEDMDQSRTNSQTWSRPAASSSLRGRP